MTKITLSSIFRAGSRAACFSLFVLLAGLVFREPVRASGIVYAAGLGLPEQIIPVTSNSGYAAGTLLVVDASTASNNNISSVYAIPPGGGTPQLVASLPSGSSAYAAAFAPNGNLVVYGSTLNGPINTNGYTATAFTLSPGSSTFAVGYADPNLNPYSIEYFAQAVVAPAGFGSIGGQTLIGEEYYSSAPAAVIQAFPSSLTPSTFTTITNFASISGTASGVAGLAFSSSGFIPGTTGQVLLADDGNSGAIDWIDSSGNVNYFTTIPLPDGDPGLRQMAVAPSGFGAYGGDLLVSVAAINGAGGTFGALDVVNGQGNIVATLSQGALGAALNPRGLYFESNSQLLVANADPSIYSVSPSDFVAAPEPGTFGAVSLALGIAAIFFYRRSASRAAYLPLLVLLAGFVFRQPVRASGIVYASGLGLPEQIVPVTSNSGYAAGTLLVVDAASTSNNGISSIYAIPPGGGTPQLVASLPSGSDAYAAAFAPNGNLVVYGYSYIGSYGTSTAFTLFAGSRTFGVRYIDPNPNSVGYLAQAVTAPAGFGSIAGETLIGEEFFNGSTSTVEAFPSTPTPSTFATITNFAPANAQNDTGPAGLAFSSNGFIAGTTGQVLLVDDAFSGAIDWIDSSGNVNYFTTIPLVNDEAGLRQMAVAPTGFGPYGGDLLVSVAAVNGAGGTFGAVDVVDGAGNVIATLSQGALGAALNPRGLYFESSSQLLVANADPSIYSVSPSDFVATPEPGTFGAVSLAFGLGAVWFYFRSRSGRKVMSC